MYNTNELTTEQIQALLNFSKRPKEQGLRDGSISRQILPEEILGDLETTSQNCSRSRTQLRGRKMDATRNDQKSIPSWA